MTRDDQLVRWQGFPAGLNNRARWTDAPADESGAPNALREAVNVSLRQNGKPVLRPGQTKRVTGKAHSLFAFGDHLFAVVDGQMRAYRQNMDGSLTLDAAYANVGDRFVSYASDDFNVYWSNGVEQGRFDENLQAHPFWVGTPDPVTLTTTTGALAPGAYEVSVTGVEADGRESGASGPVRIAITAGQGIVVALPAAPAGATRWRVYVTPPDGEVFYQNNELPISATSVAVTNLTPSAKLETLWLHPMVPCQHLRYGHGRLYGLANNVMVWSEPYRLGLMSPDNHVVLGSEATLLEPVGDADTAGCWAADHKRTYFMAGADPESWQQQARYPHAAVPGTSICVQGALFGLETSAPVAYWLARNGTPCIGLPGGQLLPQREQSLALPVDAERGASGLMLLDGIRQILTTIFGAAGNLAAASDFAEATITRRDHRTP